MVVLFHFTMERPEGKFLFKLGTTGVDLFFIISGFVIFMSLNRVKTSRDFIINRISRLYPAYWACVSITFLIVIVVEPYKHTDVSLIQYAGNLTMFQFYLGVSDIDGPYWTMIIEMIFYIGILFLFYFKLTRYLVPIGLTLCISVVALNVIFHDNRFVIALIYYIPLLQFIALFFAGIVFYKLYTDKNNVLRNYCILTLCLVSQVIMYDQSGRSKNFISQYEYAMMLALYFLIFTLFINGKLRIIISPLSLFFGKISFTLYLIHQFISTQVIIPALTNKLGVNFWVSSLLIAFPIVIGLATLITYYVEVPLSKKMKEKLRSSRIYMLARQTEPA